MTDNEIITALECCGGESCLGCPYRGKCHQGNPMIRDALDLIKSQKAEIEQWKEEANRYQNLWCEAVNDIKTAKSEAVKEFAERFAKELSEFDMSSVGLPDYDRGYEDCMTAIEYTIDTLVKEMTEVATNQRKEELNC